MPEPRTGVVMINAKRKRDVSEGGRKKKDA